MAAPLRESPSTTAPSTTAPSTTGPSTTGPSTTGRRAVILAMAIACGVTVANIYYAQPLLALIAGSFHVSRGAAATVVTATQLGYAAGLALVVPLGDMLENRRLACRTLILTAVALAVAGLSPDLALFLVMSVCIGVTSVVVQVLVPFAAHLAPPGQHGRYVGRVMSGLLIGILLARSLASVTAAAWGWRAIYLLSAGGMAVLAAALWRILPDRAPEAALPSTTGRYGRLLGSALRLVRDEPVLRRRAAAHALMFGAFSAFWTAIAYELISAHHFSQLKIAAFALVGAGGAAAALIAGPLGDRGLGMVGRGVAITLAAASMILAGAGSGSVVALAIGAVALDFAVQGNHVLSQRDVYALREDARARVNTVYITSVFIGGSAGSAVSGWLYASHGWAAVAVLGTALPLAALAIFAWDALRAPAPAPSGAADAGG